MGSLLQYSNGGRPEVWLGAILFIGSAAFCTWSMAISKLPAVGWSATLHVILQQLLTGVLHVLPCACCQLFLLLLRHKI